MTIRRLRTHITRLVLVGLMAVAFAAGGVALVPPHEAAGMTNAQFCAALVNSWWYNFNQGYYDKANAIADAYSDLC